MADHADDLIDYEEEEETSLKPLSSEKNNASGNANAAATENGLEKKDKKGSYVGVHATGFRDFLLKPDLLRAINDCGFEHPSEVQQECIPQAILGMDVLCQAKSGMGKTAVFVLATLQQIDPRTALSDEASVRAIVLCHTRELAFQIRNEYTRFCKYLPDIKTEVFFGGMPTTQNITALKKNKPHIIVGTPGRVLALIRDKHLKLNNVKHFVLDECDKMLESLGPRNPHAKKLYVSSQKTFLTFE